jgi:uncharacterized membrane protein YecN with MAPEG domain
MTKLEIAALYSGLLLVILVALAVQVTRLRRSEKVSLGDGGAPALRRAIRAHGNASEYIPAGIGGLLFLALLDPVPLWAMHVVGAALTLGRLAHGAALSQSETPSPGRVFGMTLTWLALLGAAAGLIYGALADVV